MFLENLLIQLNQVIALIQSGWDAAMQHVGDVINHMPEANHKTPAMSSKRATKAHPEASNAGSKLPSV